MPIPNSNAFSSPRGFLLRLLSPEPDSAFVPMYTIEASLPQGPPESTLRAHWRNGPWSSQLAGRGADRVAREGPKSFAKDEILVHAVRKPSDRFARSIRGRNQIPETRSRMLAYEAAPLLNATNAGEADINTPAVPTIGGTEGLRRFHDCRKYRRFVVNPIASHSSPRKWRMAKLNWSGSCKKAKWLTSAGRAGPRGEWSRRYIRCGRA